MNCGGVEEGYKMLPCLLLLRTLCSWIVLTHYITLLVVRQAHARVQHNGVKETLAEVRMKFWIIGGSLVKQIIHKCVVCRRFEGLPYHAPPRPTTSEFQSQ